MGQRESEPIELGVTFQFLLAPSFVNWLFHGREITINGTADSGVLRSLGELSPTLGTSAALFI